MANRAKRARSRKRRLRDSDRIGGGIALVDPVSELLGGASQQGGGASEQVEGAVERVGEAASSASPNGRVQASIRERRVKATRNREKWAARTQARVERAQARSARASQTSGKRAGSDRRTPISPTYCKRPRPAWHPLPLSELLIAAGAFGVIIGLRRGSSAGSAPLLAGVIAVALGTFEVTLREHRGGFRSHTIMLAFLPVLVFHTTVALGVSLVTRFPPIANVGLFAVDIALFAFMFRMMRASFLDARTKRASRR